MLCASLLAILVLAPSQGTASLDETALAPLAAETLRRATLQAIQPLREEHSGCGKLLLLKLHILGGEQQLAPERPQPRCCRSGLAGLLLVSTVDGSVHALNAESGKQVWTFSSGAPLVSSSMTWAEGPFANECVAVPTSLQTPDDRARESPHGATDVTFPVLRLDSHRFGASTVVFPHVDGSLYAYQVRCLRIPSTHPTLCAPGLRMRPSAPLTWTASDRPATTPRAAQAGVNGLQKLPMGARELVDASPSITDDGSAIVLGSRRTKARSAHCRCP